MLDLLLQSHRFLRLCLFFQSIFILLFTLGNFCCSIFQFTDSFLSFLCSAVESVHWVSNFGYCVFPFQNSYLVLISLFHSFAETSCFFSETIFFICFKCIIIAYWSIFMRAALKAWHDHSDTSVILVSASIDFFSFSCNRPDSWNNSWFSVEMWTICVLYLWNFLK